MDQSRFELRRYYRAIIRRLWLVMLFVALVVAGVYWRMGSKPPTYSASTLVMVTAPVVTTPTSVSGDQGNASLGINVSMIITDVIQLIGTRPVTERVAATLSLKKPDIVKQSVRATRLPNTNLISIRATYRDRELAAKLANTSAEVLVAHFQDVNRQDARQVRLFIGQQLAQARARLNASDREVEAYKLRYGVLDLAAEVSEASNNASQARTEREAAVKDLRETEARLTAATSRLSAEKQMRMVSGTIKDNPVFQQIETRLTDLEIQKATLSQTFTPLHPKMKVLEGEIATVRQQMQSVAKKVVDNQVSEANPVYDQLVTDIVSKQVERAALLARIDALSFLERRRRARSAQYPALQTGMNQLVRENEMLAQNYSDLSKTYQDALIRENEAGYMLAGMQVMEHAVSPTKPVGVRPPVRFAIAGLVGLLLGLLAAVLLDTTDDRIRTSVDAERAFGAPVLAEVPDVAQPRGAPAAAALLLIVMALLLGVAFGGAFVKVDPQAQPTALVTLSSRLMRGVEVIPAWLAQVAR